MRTTAVLTGRHSISAGLMPVEEQLDSDLAKIAFVTGGVDVTTQPRSRSPVHHLLPAFLPR